jgi:hypothetical protein
LLKFKFKYGWSDPIRENEFVGDAINEYERLIFLHLQIFKLNEPTGIDLIVIRYFVAHLILQLLLSWRE